MIGRPFRYVPIVCRKYRSAIIDLCADNEKGVFIEINDGLRQITEIYVILFTHARQ